jgi:hypothetical protein
MGLPASMMIILLTILACVFLAIGVLFWWSSRRLEDAIRLERAHLEQQLHKVDILQEKRQARLEMEVVKKREELLRLQEELDRTTHSKLQVIDTRHSQLEARTQDTIAKMEQLAIFLLEQQRQWAAKVQGQLQDQQSYLIQSQQGEWQKQNQRLDALERHQAQLNESLLEEWRKFRLQFTDLPYQASSVVKSLLMTLLSEGDHSPLFAGPYTAGPPVAEPSDFYDRYAAINEFYEALLAKRVAWIVILGLPKSGKTSFLRYVTHPQVLDSRLGRHQEELLFVDVTPSSHISGPSDFYTSLIIDCTRALARRVGTVLPIFPKHEAVNLTGLSSFLEVVQQSGRLVVFLIDDFERLTSGEIFGKDFFDDLRLLLEGQQMVLVTTSFREPSPKSKRKRVSSSLERIYLGAFHEEEARRLVSQPAAKAGVVLMPEDITFIQRLAGHLPYPLQLASWFLLKSHQEGLSKTEAEVAVRSAFSSAMSPTFAAWWAGLNTDEQEVLKSLAYRAPQKQSNFGRGRWEDIIAGLENYGLLNRTADGFWLSSDGFSTWIRQQHTRA